MPTYDALPRFAADLDRLTPEQRRTFRHVVTRAFVPNLRASRFYAGLRITRVRYAPGVYRRPRLCRTGRAHAAQRLLSRLPQSLEKASRKA
ncbi:hypothetical protein ACFQ6V_13060 [Streptomyces roseifaciens]